MILTDNGECITNKFLRSYVDSKEAKLIHTTPFHSQANRFKRSHKEMQRLWHIFCKETHRDWGKHVNQIIYLLSHNIIKMTGVSPAQAYLNFRFNISYQKIIRVDDAEGN